MILDAYVLTDDDNQVVDALQVDDTYPSSSWSDDNASALRTSIKRHYVAEQGSRCCYCAMFRASENLRIWDLDHVASRRLHPQWTFEPRNLAICCPDCNNAKSDSPTLASGNPKQYPASGAAFRIVHPHYDSYSDHIARYGVLYFPKSDKGRNTIYLCDLLRFGQKYIDWPTSLGDMRFEGDVAALMEGGPGSHSALTTLIDSVQASSCDVDGMGPGNFS